MNIPGKVRFISHESIDRHYLQTLRDAPGSDASACWRHEQLRQASHGVLEADGVLQISTPGLEAAAAVLEALAAHWDVDDVRFSIGRAINLAIAAGDPHVIGFFGVEPLQGVRS